MHRNDTGEYIDSKFNSWVEIFDSPKITNSLIYGGQIFDSPNILRSSLSGFPRISGRPIIRDSHISGTSQVSGMSHILDSVVAGNSVVTKDAKVFNSEIYDNSRVLDSSWIRNCLMYDNAMVCGTASVKGTNECPVVLGGWDYVEEGLWTRSPIVYQSSCGLFVAESVGRKVVINCLTTTVDRWLTNNGKAGRRYAQNLGLDNYQIDELRYYIEQIKEFKDRKEYDMAVDKE